MRVMTLAIALAALAGCGGLRVQSDYDHSHQFSGYQTFAWMNEEPMMAPSGQLDRVSPLNRHRIVQAIEAELESKGFRKLTAPSDADFVVSYTVGARNMISANSYPGVYRGPWRWGGPYYGDDVDVRTYREGTLAIDIFDGAKYQPVWHGWATKEITAHDVKTAAQQIPIAVKEILKSFPPG